MKLSARQEEWRRLWIEAYAEAAVIIPWPNLWAGAEDLVPDHRELEAQCWLARDRKALELVRQRGGEEAATWGQRATVRGG